MSNKIFELEVYDFDFDYPDHDLLNLDWDVWDVSCHVVVVTSKLGITRT